MEIQETILHHNFTLFDFLPLGVAVLESDYRIVFWNRRLESWTGISSQTIVGSDIREWFPYLKQPRYRARFDSVFQGGAPAIFSAQIHNYIIPAPLHTDEKRLQNTTVCAYDKGDSTFLALIFCEDVTEVFKRLKDYSEMKDRALNELEQRQLAERSLRENESKLRGITDSAQDAIIMLDSKGLIHFWNPAAERMFGYSSEEVRNREMHELVVPEAQREAARKGMRAFLEQEEVGSGSWLQEVEAVRRSGAVFPVEVSIAPVHFQGQWFLVGNVRDVSERREYERQLRELANRDGLTKVLNRRHFMDLAEHEVLRSERYREPLSLLMLDLDYFKEVNDTYGHQVGDIVLKELADILGGSLRKSDILGRVGGEEFAVLLPNTSGAQGAQVGEKLRGKVEQAQFDASCNKLRCKLSIGVAGIEAVEYDLNRLLEGADKALYRAKQMGRNRIETCRV